LPALALPPLSPAHRHIDLLAAAAGTDEQRAPTAVSPSSGSHLGLTLIAAAIIRLTSSDTASLSPALGHA